MTGLMLASSLPLANRRAGKVRDLYDLKLPDGAAGLLMVATDRVSVFDVVLDGGIPGKGVLLTRLSTFWFDFFADDCAGHLVSTDPADIPGLTDEQRQGLEGRIMICRKVDILPVECIVRGYLAGSGYRDYLKTGAVCDLPLPAGLVNGDRLASPLFTPSTKAQHGHDENISFARACELVGADLMRRVRDLSFRIYEKGRAHAESRGILIADTKLEFGLGPDGSLVLADEALTPDSSRFWAADAWAPGREQDSFDKQYVRNYTEELLASGEWNREAPGPRLPDHVIAGALARYEEALGRLTA